MLYLTLPANSAAEGVAPRFPLVEQTALRLERVVLSSDRTVRQQELAVALAEDQQIAQWSLRTAERRLNTTINRLEEAVDWLTDCLETELASALVREDSRLSPENSDIEWRLPALLSKLSAYEARLGAFHARLEREKLESLKELAYGASHEINNPLANIAARAQTLLQEEHDPERARKLAAIHRQAMRAHEMIADLMLFARPPKLQRTCCRLDQLVEEVADEFKQRAGELQVELICVHSTEPLETHADKTQLGAALSAVVLNALEASAGGGHVRLNARQITLRNQSWAEIVVGDDGPGLSEHIRQHMFDPFFSGREAGRGLGFGLSKCWRIVTDHGGQVIVRNPQTQGTEIAILLPLDPESVAA
jgi:signal transduction histidine kinase